MALEGPAGIEGSTDPGAWLAHLFGFRLAGMRAHVIAANLIGCRCAV